MKLRVVRVDPGQAPVDIEIPNNLQGLQGVVGGNLEPVHRVRLQVGRELVYYANEDGRSRGLPPNRTVGPHDVVGTILVVAVSANQEDSLTADEVKKVVGELTQTHRAACGRCHKDVSNGGQTRVYTTLAEAMATDIEPMIWCDDCVAKHATPFIVETPVGSVPYTVHLVRQHGAA